MGDHRRSPRIAEKAERPFTFEGKPLRMSASSGVAIYPDDGDQPDVLMEIADQAMYVNKRERKRAAASGTGELQAARR